MDIFEKLHKNRGPLGQYQQEADGYFMFPKLEGEIAPYMKFQGKEVLTWSINNYLGLANHPDARKADAQAAEEYGMAYPMGSRMLTGNSSKHEELETRLANFVDKKYGFLLNYGYQGVLSIIDAVVDRNDVIVYDSDSHACIVDGVRLHMGKRFVYPHNDMEKLQKQLEHAQKVAASTGGGILVITEGVFGMAGDLGNLEAITALKKQYDFRLLIDDAHGFGTMGETGGGTGLHFGVQDDVDLYFGTFAKAMAGIGAFVASNNKSIIDYLKFNMRSQIFAKALPMPMVIGALKRLEMIENDPKHRENLWNNVHLLQNGLKEAGFNLGRTQSPVTPVFLKGSLAEATNITMDLRENYNIFCSIVAYPVVPKGVIMLRLIPTAVHTAEQVNYTIESFKAVLKKLINKEYNTENIGVQ